MISICRFLWTLYCNDSGTHITRNEFQNALQIEGSLPSSKNKTNLTEDPRLLSLFRSGQDKVTFEEFKVWMKDNKGATILSEW